MRHLKKQRHTILLVQWLSLILLGAIPLTATGQDREPFPMEKLEKSALEGDAFAQYYLALFCEEGRGVQKDIDEAIKWYGKAEEQGNADAQYRLAEFYADGEAGEKDMTEALKLCRKAAAQGHDGAQLKLGRCYQSGSGVPKNVTEAYVWISLSAENGGAANGRGLAGVLLDDLSKGLTPAELTEAKAEARKRQQEVSKRVTANNQKIINELNRAGYGVTITKDEEGDYSASAKQLNHCTYACKSPNLRVAVKVMLAHYRNYSPFPPKSE